MHLDPMAAGLKNMVLLLMISVALTTAAAQQLLPVVDVDPIDPGGTKIHVHVANGLSNAILFVHCKSKDTDIGEHYLDIEAQIQWTFAANIWGTTLFWCFWRKPGGSVSGDVWWSESDHRWLQDRCSRVRSCIWIAKDDGIYIRNLMDNVDELIHKWNE